MAGRFRGGSRSLRDGPRRRRLDLSIVDGEFMCWSARLVAARRPRCGWWPAWRRSATASSDRRRVVNDLSPKSRDIAMVFQSYALYPHLTVATTSRSRSRSRRSEDGDRPRVDDAARDPRPRAVLQAEAARALGRQRQRVAMGRAIVREPRRS
jgi:multiple sugar transport system ATP-binding protein